MGGGGFESYLFQKKWNHDEIHWLGQRQVDHVTLKGLLYLCAAPVHPWTKVNRNPVCIAIGLRTHTLVSFELPLSMSRGIPGPAGMCALRLHIPSGPWYWTNPMCWTFVSKWPLVCPQPAWVLSAAAKTLQSCPTLCDPIDGSPPGSPVPGILKAGTLEGSL